MAKINQLTSITWHQSQCINKLPFTWFHSYCTNHLTLITLYLSSDNNHGSSLIFSINHNAPIIIWYKLTVNHTVQITCHLSSITGINHMTSITSYNRQKILRQVRTLIRVILAIPTKTTNLIIHVSEDLETISLKSGFLISACKDVSPNCPPIVNTRLDSAGGPILLSFLAVHKIRYYVSLRPALCSTRQQIR